MSTAGSPKDGDAASARDRARAAMTEDILGVARRQLAEVGPAQLSLRGVARELGVAVSGLYRYVDGRDALLTGLVTSGYERLGAAVEAVEAAAPRDRYRERWHTIYHAVREWALSHPHEWALLYGTPVIGYVAPPQTIRPAMTVVRLLATVALDAQRDGVRETPRDLVDPVGPPSLRAGAERVVAGLADLGFPTDVEIELGDVFRVISAWAELAGTVSFELWGHFVNGIEDVAAHLGVLAETWAIRVGLPTGDEPPS